MNFDTSMVIDYLIPNSLRDFGAILLWILIILLAIIVTMDIRFYLENRKMSKNEERVILEESGKKVDTTEQKKKSTEDRIKEHIEIRNKIDKIIELNN